MDCILGVIGVFILIISGMFEDRYIRSLIRLFGAILILVAGLLFVAGLIKGYNAGMQLWR